MRSRTALLAVLGNAVVMGAAGVSAPIGWLLVPGVAGMWSRPRVAALVAGCAAALIAVSIELPIVAGHSGDGWSLVTSGICLASLPAVSWARQRARIHQAPDAGPAVSDIGAGVVDRIVVLATSRLPGEIATAVAGRGFGIRVLLGVVMGEVADQRRCAHAVERDFRAAAARADRDLPDVAAELESTTRRYAGTGFVAATCDACPPTHGSRSLPPDTRVLTTTTTSTPCTGRCRPPVPNTPRCNCCWALHEPGQTSAWPAQRWSSTQPRPRPDAGCRPGVADRVAADHTRDDGTAHASQQAYACGAKAYRRWHDRPSTRSWSQGGHQGRCRQTGSPRPIENNLLTRRVKLQPISAAQISRPIRHRLSVLMTVR